MDGELYGVEQQGAVDELLTNEAHRRCWERYHVISNAMRHNLPGGLDSGLASRVMAALENEPTVLAPTLASAQPSTPTPISISSLTQAQPPTEHSTQKMQSRSLLGRKMTGLAVAASVAAVTVLGVQNLYRADSAAPSVAPMAKASAEHSFQRASRQDIARATLPSMTRSMRGMSGVQTVNTPLSSVRPQIQIPNRLPSQMRQTVRPNLYPYLMDHNRQATRMVVGVMPYARMVTPPYRTQSKNLQRELLRQEQQQGLR
ncbi:MAG: sigma-E factor negative regulatory protein [Gammaproteobacteria bacterium]|nr:sigma-E factor negative regulatory protein [Gammaproteobacteria bacterium]